MTRYESLGWAAAIVGLMFLSFWSGATMQSLKDVEEYEEGYKAGWKDALYTRPVHDELEMVCLSLWVSSLPERPTK